jgi:hypothetical protein
MANEHKDEVAQLQARLREILGPADPGTPATVNQILGRKLVAAEARVTELEAEREQLLDEHRVVVANLADALCPDSPPESAKAEFTLDAMGACQIIRRLRAEREGLRTQLKRHRQGLSNILEFRRCTDGRYGALTREEVEQAIAEMDAALAPQPAGPSTDPLAGAR